MDEQADNDMVWLKEIVTSARKARADAGVDPKQTVEGELFATGRTLEVARVNADAIARIARVKLELREEEPFRLKLALKVDRAKVEKEITELEKVIANSQRQLSNEGFTSKAPAKIIDGMRAKQAEYEAQVAKLRASLADSE
jgi:valyl-tRNA synthetase